MDAGYNRRLHASTGPNLASLRSHPDRYDAYQAPFTYPTRLQAPKSASFPYPTPVSASKSASFTQPTRLQAPKRAVCVNLPIEVDYLYIVHVNHFTKSHQINRVCIYHTIQSNQINAVYLMQLIELGQIYTVNTSHFI